MKWLWHWIGKLRVGGSNTLSGKQHWNETNSSRNDEFLHWYKQNRFCSCSAMILKILKYALPIRSRRDLHWIMLININLIMNPFSFIFSDHDNIDVCTIHLVTSRLATNHFCWCSGYNIGLITQSVVVPTLGKQPSNEANCLNIDKVQLRCDLKAFAHAGW